MARNWNGGTDEISGALTIGSLLSISLWARTATDPTGNDYCMIQIQDESVSNKYLRLNTKATGAAGNFGYRVSDGTGSDSRIGSTLPTIGTWYHIGFTNYNSSDDRLFYVNGSLDITGTTNLATFTKTSVSIGREGDSSPGDSWDGDIAEVAIWDVQLTAAEFAVLGAGYSPQFVRPASRVFYSPLIRETLELTDSITLTSAGTTVSDHPPIIRPSYHTLRTTVAAAGGRVMGSLIGYGGLAGRGGGLAG